MTNDLVAFLKAHLDEDADLARRCDGAEFSAGGAPCAAAGPKWRAWGASIPTTIDPGRAEQMRPWSPGRPYSGALHLDARNHARSTVRGSRAGGREAGRVVS